MSRPWWGPGAPGGALRTSGGPRLPRGARSGALLNGSCQPGQISASTRRESARSSTRRCDNYPRAVIRASIPSEKSSGARAAAGVKQKHRVSTRTIGRAVVRTVDRATQHSQEDSIAALARDTTTKNPLERRGAARRRSRNWIERKETGQG